MSLKNKYLSLVLIILSSFTANAQWTRPNQSYGNIQFRIKLDSVILMPTGCGKPPKLNKSDSAQKAAAIYFDSCGHTAFVWDPSTNLWDTLVKRNGSGTSGNDTAYVGYTKVNDSLYLFLHSNRTIPADSFKIHFPASSAGITALTGDVTASGTGSVVATLKTVTTAGSCTNCNITYDAQGRIIVTTNGSSGTGGFNTNVGSGNRLAIPGTNSIKTLVAGYGTKLDSLTTNAITITVDTSLIASVARLSNDSAVLAALANSKQSQLSGTGYVKQSGTTTTFVAAIPNADLQNSSITINGTAVSLGGSTTISPTDTTGKFVNAVTQLTDTTVAVYKGTGSTTLLFRPRPDSLLFQRIGDSINLSNSGSSKSVYAPLSPSLTNSLTFNNSGAGAASGTTFNGSTAPTISYNTIGAQPAGSYLTTEKDTTAFNRVLVTNSNYTASPNDGVSDSATTGNFNVLLPNNPINKTRVLVKSIALGIGDTVKILTQGTDTLNYKGGGVQYNLFLKNQSVTFQYNNPAKIWTAINGDLPVGQLDTRYLQAYKIKAGTNITTSTGSDSSVTINASGGGTTYTTQTYTSGSSVTIADASDWLIVNPAAVISSAFTITLPANPADRETVTLSFGGTIAGGSDVVTNLTLAANTGQTLDQNFSPTYFQSGETVRYRYNLSTTKWYAQ